MRPRDLDDDEPLSASWLNQFLAYIAANEITIAPDSGLTGSVGPRGTTIGVQDTPAIWIKLTYVGTGTGVAGSYSWIEQVPAASGGWSNGFRSGFLASDPSLPTGLPPDPAWEANLNSGLSVGYITEASRDPAVGRLSFRAGSC